MRPLPSFIFNLLANLLYGKQLVHHIQEGLTSVKGKKILDAPCGTGILLKYCNQFSYVGADIDVTRVFAAKHAYPDKNFVIADASSLGFKDKEFDGVIALGLFHHVDDETALKILSEFKRILKSHGKIIVIEAVWPARCYNIIGFVGRKLDQGNFVRHSTEFEFLFKQHFKIEKKSCFLNFGLENLSATLVLDI